MQSRRREASNERWRDRPRAGTRASTLPPGSRATALCCPLVALLVVFSIARADVFPTLDNILNIMNQISILGAMAFGLTVCLVMGLFDLSIAAMATLGGYVATFLLVQYPDTISVPLAVCDLDWRRRRDRRSQRSDRQLSRHFRLHRHARDRIDHHRRDARHFELQDDHHGHTR